MNKKINYTEFIIGLIVLFGVILLGKAKLASDMLVFRLLIGISLGYVFARAYTGFAGSVNRAYTTGSTKLMRAMMIMFFVAALGVAGLLVFNLNPETQTVLVEYGLNVKPINLGLILGAMMFGFGMSMSSCCASGMMSDLANEAPKAIITMFFFGMGVVLGMPFDKASWVNNSWFTAGENNGVFFPDLFNGSSLYNMLGGVILTGILALIVIVLAYAYESYRKRKGTLGVVPSELKAENERHIEVPAEKDQLFTYVFNKVFVNSWSVYTGALLIAVIFIIIVAATKGGWGASGPFGNWFAKVIMVFGVKAETLANYAGQEPEFFSASIFSNGTGIQNMGIFIGALTYLLTSGQMKETSQNFFNYPKIQWFLFMLGGLTMGVGTRLAKGCNAGGLFTPIAHMSLSGWFFLLALIVGGILGNTFQKLIFDKVSQ
ncbi:YeeE/YedE family protein [Erysipelothrix urinaevulpis]|uniref:YeeE/YedE family protein n=1 Tax=Erysipelothrix urinaevulpis TaxID=2683717 RepID=UPI00135AA13A|nr:YeeE/YedE family protein [Erysipelothrix urinaevulpis]